MVELRCEQGSCCCCDVGELLAVAGELVAAKVLNWWAGGAGLRCALVVDG